MGSFYLLNVILAIVSMSYEQVYQRDLADDEEIATALSQYALEDDEDLDNPEGPGSLTATLTTRNEDFYEGLPGDPRKGHRRSPFRRHSAPARLCSAGAFDMEVFGHPDGLLLVRCLHPIY
ncbi:unnamed protein product [Dibothriocephalus latus]|uniref:Ion transport domain-containing protein n=1 Tax=Dibothriocephalus latus TaxID=60516 RepID=A0A3P7NHI4_DIBLA|nr:unnamed protein product [Dibothriocephalus latus]